MNAAVYIYNIKEELHMYIADKYWNNYIGDTDDSLTLIEYLADKQKDIISLEEIFSDTGLDKLNGDFRQHEEPLTIAFSHEEADVEDPYAEIYCAIDLITDLAALLLECRINGHVNLCELAGYDLEVSAPYICITAAPKELKLMDQALKDFAAEPLTYNLSEMCPEEEMYEMAKLCGELRDELYA